MLNAGGNQFAVYTWRCSDAWDPDPAIASASVTGFKEWAALYSHWKVLSTSLESTLVNTTGSILHAYWLWSVNIPTISSTGDAISSSELSTASRISTHTPLGTNAAIASWKLSKDMAELYGNRVQYDAREDYAGIATTSPASPALRMYVSCIVYSANSWSSALDHKLRLSFRIKFYGRYTVPS